MSTLVQRYLKIIIPFNKYRASRRKCNIPANTRYAIQTRMKFFCHFDCFFIERHIDTIKFDFCIWVLFAVNLIANREFIVTVPKKDTLGIYSDNQPSGSPIVYSVAIRTKPQHSRQSIYCSILFTACY